MRKLTYIAIVAGATVLGPVCGTSFAAGPFPYVFNDVHLPYDGDALGSGNGFTIDHAAFDRSNVTAAPCPVNASCTNMTATSADDNFLVREVHDPGSGNRYLQTIFAESDAVDGDFIFESAVSSQNAPIYDEEEGPGGNIGSKHIIDVPDTGDGSFFLSFAMFQGYEHFGNDYEHPWIDVTQVVDGFQTFSMLATIPAEVGQQFIGGRLQIIQDGAGNMPSFGHTIVSGAWAPNVPETLEIGDQVLENSGGTLSATWIGAGMSGGGPGIDTLAPGQTQNHDTRVGDQRDFGLLIYRDWGNRAPTAGNAGGTPNGLLDPQFTQNAPPGGTNEPLDEIRGFSLQSDQNDSGVMSNTGHGSFVGGADLLVDYWVETIFGPNPY
jgi:hypothetical protein